MLKYFSLAMVCLCSLSTVTFGTDWPAVPYVDHSDYQAVNVDGTSAYGGGFPIRMIGVVLNDNEDWLDSTSDYDSGVHMWEMGGEAEFYVQAVNLDGSGFDSRPASSFTDFGGTACWVGQNYGNHIKNQDPYFNYTDAQWYSELDRLGFWRPGSTLSENQLVRSGDLVEVRVHGGLYYSGKMNVNELHTNNPATDFEIVILQKGFGLPAPQSIQLSDLKDGSDSFLFDSAGPTREFGGELYQSSLVELTKVYFTDVTNWGASGDFTVTDDAGRTLNVHLGLDASFDSMIVPELGKYYSLVGIMDQSDFSGRGGYQLLVMDGSNITPVPEPTTIGLVGFVVFAMVRRRSKIA